MNNCQACGEEIAQSCELCPTCKGLLRWVLGYYAHDPKLAGKITLATTFRDLSTDSLDWVEWHLEWEEKLGVQLSEAAEDRIFTIRDLVRELKLSGAHWPDQSELDLLQQGCAGYQWGVRRKVR